MKDGNLYQDDFHAWALDQASRLRTVAQVQATEHIGIDFEHVIEEVEDLGHSHRRKVESNLEVAIKHIIRLTVLPQSEASGHSKKEINAFRDSAIDGYTSSMRRYIDLDKLWAKARKRTLRDLSLNGHEVTGIPLSNPFHLDQLLNEEFDVDALLAVLASTTPPSET